MEFLMKNKAQVWIETAMYTLIGLVIIGVVLGIATPSIDRYKDEIVLEQTVTAINSLNEKIIEAADSGSGNRRLIPELRIKKGKIDIDSTGNSINYVLEESRLEYSEPGVEVNQGDIIIKTEERGRRYDIYLSLSYDDIDLMYNGEEQNKTFHPVATPYKIFVENNGTIGNKVKINIEEIS